MARGEKDSSHEGLLQSRKNDPLRPSLDEAYRSSSEDDDLDGLDMLQDADEGGWKNADMSRNTSRAYEKIGPRQEKRGQMRRIGRLCWSCRTCLIVTFVLLTLLFIGAGGSGYWIYKKAPEDGVRYLPS